MTEPLLSTLVVLLGTALVVILLLRHLGAPGAIGYILAGVLLGGAGLGDLPGSEDLRAFAGHGVLFLMFYAGLEFSLPVLAAARRAVFVIGTLEVAAVTALGAMLSWLWGVPALPAVVVGGALAMSSTALTLRQLADQGELTAPHGRIAVGVLLFQDVATLPFLVLVATLRGQGAVAAPTLWAELAVTLLTGVAAFAAAILVGRRLLVRAVDALARSGSREVFTLAMLLVVLGAGWAFQAVGLSAPLGAFLAGMILGETDLKGRAEEDLRPFRDVLIGLFFVGIGLQLDPAAVLADAPLVLVLSASIVLGKGLITFAAARLAGTRPADAARAGAILAHAGEFALLIIVLAEAGGILPVTLGQPLLAAVVLTMVAAPLLIAHAAPLARRLTGEAP